MKRTSKQRADRTRKAILNAAIREFSAHGLAGARTDTIAASAKVNKALLYYYFKNKRGLYTAALEEIATATVERALEVLDPTRSAGERLLRMVANHFDRILTQREFQNLLQQEMVRLRQGQSGTMAPLVKHVFKPLMLKLQETVQEAIESGELCSATDWLQVVYCAFGANTFYFLSAPLMRMLLPSDPMDSDAISSRRKTAIQFLGSALFADRVHGAAVARRVLEEMPMPQATKIWRKCS